MSNKDVEIINILTELEIVKSDYLKLRERLDLVDKILENNLNFFEKNSIFLQKDDPFA